MNITRPILLSVGLALFGATSADAQVIIQQQQPPTYFPDYGHLRPGYFPGYGQLQPAVRPAVVQPIYPQPGFAPAPILRDKDVERYVERAIRAQFGRIIDDVDVDVDRDDGEIEIEVEVRGVNPRFVHGQIHAFVCSLPVLRGYRVDLEVDD